MIVNMSFKHMDATQGIKSYASEKSEKLKKFFRGRITVDWNFSVEKQNQVAHCHLKGNNMDYFGEAISSDLYASIDQAVDKIEKQLRKHKEKVKDHLHRNGHRTPSNGHSED